MNSSKRIELIEKIKRLEGITNDERADLLQLLNQTKTYGLVWEEKQEDVEVRLQKELPVLKEVKSRAIIAPNMGGVSNSLIPNHLIIEGDNLEALTALTYTHEGKIDVIYIDPPYNTGNKDFIYNDSYVDSEDSYRHSKWLSFMSKRLRIAKRLLSDRGVIFISIDDNEQANLKLLCDEVFGSNNFIAELPTIMNLKGNQDEFGFAGTHEYTIVYAKLKVSATIGVLPLDEDDNLEWDIDSLGYYKRGAALKGTGINAPRVKRPNLFFPVFINSDDKVAIPTKNEVEQLFNKSSKTFNDSYLDVLIYTYKVKGYKPILPITNGDFMSWRWSRGKMESEKHDIIIVHTKNETTLYKKQRPQIGDLPSKKAKSCFYKPEYSSGNGKSEIISVLGESSFGYPKPLSLIKDFIFIGCPQNSTILDFFAGSGTTLHATMQLNAEDGGTRQCILCTNNENGICENVTYERNKRVINGYTKPNGEAVEGLHGNNLRYYKTDFISRRRTPQNMRRLMLLSSDMLCIKENLYSEHDNFGKLKPLECGFRYFADGNKQMLIIYNEEAIYPIIEEIERMTPAEPIIIYVFSLGNDAWNAEFESVDDKVRLTALPAAIYNAYKRVLPKPKDEEIFTEETSAEKETDEDLAGLFSQGGNK